MVYVVFADIGNVPAYNFDFKALRLTAILFIVVYDLTMYFYLLRINSYV